MIVDKKQNVGEKQEIVNPRDKEYQKEKQRFLNRRRKMISSLAFYYLAKNRFNLRIAKKMLREKVKERFYIRMSEFWITRVFENIRGQMNKPLLFESLQMQLLATTQEVIDYAMEAYKINGDTQEILDVLKFTAEITGFLKGIEINQTNYNTEFNIDEILANITTGIDRVSPILERVKQIGQLSGSESPFYIHPSRETEAILVQPEQRNMGDGR